MHLLNTLLLAAALATVAPLDLPAPGKAMAQEALPPVSDQFDGLPGRDEARWLSAVGIDWEASREIAVGLVCRLGLISLALMDCGWDVAEADVPRVLILTPVDTSLRGGEPGGPDVRDVRRRTIEERMHSI